METRRLPRGLLGAVLLLAAVELQVARRPAFDLLSATWRAAGETTRHAAAGRRLLVLGDSLMRHGVLPRVLQERVGLSAYNLGLPGGRIAASESLLKRAIAAGSVPEFVLLDGELLASSPLELVRPWLDLLTPGELVQLGWDARDGRAAGTLLAQWLVPSWRDRRELRDAVLGRGRDDRSILAIYLRNGRRNLGAQVLPVAPPPVVYVPEVREIGGLYVHPGNLRALKRLLALTARHGVRVVWLLTPIHPAQQDYRDRSGWTASYRHWLRRLQARHPHLWVVDAQSARYPAEALADATHLNRLGAARFSADLATAFPIGGAQSSSSRTAPRWIKLPPYRSEPIATEIEDVGESQLALARAAANVSQRVRR